MHYNTSIIIASKNAIKNPAVPWAVVLNCSPERWVPTQLVYRSSLQRLLRRS
jgi:hypothetical protein